MGKGFSAEIGCIAALIVSMTMRTTFYCYNVNKRFDTAVKALAKDGIQVLNILFKAECVCQSRGGVWRREPLNLIELISRHSMYGGQKHAMDRSGVGGATKNTRALFFTYESHVYDFDE